MVIAGPVGLGTAVYLSEYASPRVRRVLKPVVEVLAGIPSVAIGFFALAFIGPEVVQRLVEGRPRRRWRPPASAWDPHHPARGIGVGGRHAGRAPLAPGGVLRHGRVEGTTTCRVVVPAAVSGLVAAFIVALSRAIGETMVVFIAAGRTGGALLPPTRSKGG